MIRTTGSRFACSSTRSTATTTTATVASATTPLTTAFGGRTSSVLTTQRHVSVLPTSTRKTSSPLRSSSCVAPISTAAVSSSRSSKSAKSNLSSLPSSVTSVLRQTARGLLSQQRREVSTGSSSSDLYQNIYFSADASASRDGPRYVEVTPNELRLEFLDTSSDYRQHASLMFCDDNEKQNVPSCFIPRSVENNISHGAGATIVLDKQDVLDYFKTETHL